MSYERMKSDKSVVATMQMIVISIISINILSLLCSLNIIIVIITIRSALKVSVSG